MQSSAVFTQSVGTHATQIVLDKQVLQNCGDLPSDTTMEWVATALHRAAIDNNVLVEALLSWGADVNLQDRVGATPLHVACQEGNLPCVLTLLKAGANVTLPNNWGGLPIHIAAQHNRVEIVKTLLEHGCSPDMVS